MFSILWFISLLPISTTSSQFSFLNSEDWMRMSSIMIFWKSWYLILMRTVARVHYSFFCQYVTPDFWMVVNLIYCILCENLLLLFWQGVFEINQLVDKLAASYRFSGPSSEWILPLHSSMTPDDQRKVFLQPPGEIRKVHLLFWLLRNLLSLRLIYYCDGFCLVLDNCRYKYSGDKYYNRWCGLCHWQWETQGKPLQSPKGRFSSSFLFLFMNKEIIL